MNLKERIAAISGAEVLRMQSLNGGCIGEVWRADLADGRRLAVKHARSGAGTLDIEGEMLDYLASQSSLPVPAVLHTAPDLLLMEFLPGESHFSDSAQRHAAELIADLHSRSAPKFGFSRDTLIGGLPQPNPWTDSWIEFFGKQRLRHMAKEAEKAGRLPSGTRRKVERLVDKLDEYLDEPEAPSLLHGDLWTTNVLAQGGRVTGFIDPAVYYGDPEIELAFTTLFGTFGSCFFERYQELRPIAPGFFELRRDLYNLYPLLVHARLFGGGYADSVERIVSRLV